MTGGQYGQAAATQHVQGSSSGGSAQKERKWRNTFAPGNQQRAIAQAHGGSSSTSAPGLGAGTGAGTGAGAGAGAGTGAGAGAGAYGVSG